MSVLLIGIGNTLRRDDGAGPAVVEQIRARPHLRKRSTHQLLPEHAEALGECEHVAFVDAAVNVTAVHFSEIEPGEGQTLLGHRCDPAWLLDLTQQLYGRTPQAFLLCIPASDLGYGEGFSTHTAHAISCAIERLETWLESLGLQCPSADPREEFPSG